MATDYCVKFTALDSISEGFNTYIIKDAVKGVNINDDDSKNSIKEMKKRGINIITSKNI